MYYLSPHAYCCIFNDGAVVLDLRDGKYLGIDSRYLPALMAKVVDWPPTTTLRHEDKPQNVDDSDQLISTLYKRNILTTNASFRLAVQLPAPRISVSATGCGTLGKGIPIKHKVLFVVAVFCVVLIRHKLRLEPIIVWLRDRQATITCRHTPDMGQITRLLWSFERMRVWFYTARQHCLFDSLVLSAFLSLARQPCSLVIAASTKPFLAHSWVQVNGAVLNDTIEHVQLFSPLLVVG